MGIDLGKINAVAELERVGWEFEPSSSDEIKCKCPVHTDENPSVTLNTEKNLWICHAAGCGGKGDIISLLAFILQCERKTVLLDLDKRYNLKVVKTVNPATVEKFHAAIWKAGPFLQELYKRALTDDDIRQARIGYDNGRIIIPVYDSDGRIINLRKYLPGAPGPEKMKNLSGYVTKALYQIEQLKYPTVWICGGEIKALVAKRFLNEMNVGALAITAGEGSWDMRFSDLFREKHVFICMDIDAGGRVAANKVADQLRLFAESIHIVQLPLDKKKFPKGDINDWVYTEDVSVADFDSLQKHSESYVYETVEEPEELEAKECRLIDAAKACNIGARVGCSAIISALDAVPFIVPKTIRAKCSKDQDQCGSCRIHAMKPNADGHIELDIRPTNPALLEMVDASNKGMEEKLFKALKIPKCRVVEFEAVDNYNALDTRLSTPLEASGNNDDHIVQPAVIITDRYLDLNTPYQIEGKPFPNPKSSQAILLIDKIEEKEDSLSSFKFDRLDDLELFQPDQWTVESLSTKLKDVYTDLSHNVTRIFERQDLHLAVDLAFHSALYFNLDGRTQNGWINCLIAGDSSQGKSEVSSRLSEHYNAGVRYDCKNASEAGLLGGLQQMGTRWFVSWGVIPKHDRRLVIMEEIKGANEAVLGRLTDMRSSGFAELTKIEQRKAYARTRLIMISNPRSDRSVGAYSYGVEIIKELMGSLEDVRRFDFAVIVSANEIDNKVINRMTTEIKPKKPKYTSELSRKLVLWAWTRQSEEIVITEAVQRVCIEKAIDICSRFSESMPICDKGTMRYKIARLAIALACRTFSTDDHNNVLVRECHVEYICKYLEKMYSRPDFGYKDYSEAIEYTSRITDPDMISKVIAETKYSKEFAEQLLHTEHIAPQDIQDWCEVDRDGSQKLISTLVRKRALFRSGRSYHKSEGFITLLRRLISNGQLRDSSDKEEF